jgi:ketosteroid isomerase-like protein
MNSRSTWAFVLLLAAAPAIAAPPPPASPGSAAAPDDVSREVERLERELVAAIRTGDLAVYDRIVADDYVVVGASGDRTKREVMASYRSGERSYPGLEIADVGVHMYGDTAVVAAKTLGNRKEGGKEEPNRVRYVRVYARRGGRWQAVAQMAVPQTTP